MLKISTFVLLCLGFISLRAQEIITTTGGNATGSGGSASFSVGQIGYNTFTGTTGSISEGVQQPYEISVVTGIKIANDISVNYTIYPNPTNDLLILKTESYKTKNLYYQLFDINGKLLESQKIENCETNINTSKLAPAVYFLKIMENRKVIKNFKIIKTQ